MGKTIEVWVPLIGDGHDTMYRPDIPDDMAFSSDECAPTDLMQDDGRPAVTAFNIIIDEADRDRITEIEPPEKDVQLVNMIRACRGDYDGKAEAFFDAVPSVKTANAERKRMVKDVLLQGVARSLDAEIAQGIHAKHALPDSPKTTGAMDDEIIEAKYAYGLRKYGPGPGLDIELAEDIERGFLTQARADVLREEKIMPDILQKAMNP